MAGASSNAQRKPRRPQCISYFNKADRLSKQKRSDLMLVDVIQIKLRLDSTSTLKRPWRVIVDSS